VSASRTRAAKRAWNVPARVAVVYASGGIASGTSGNDLLMGPSMGAETMTSQIERAFRQPGVKSVVLRVESPGGSSMASSLIRHALDRMKRETGKPLIVSMGSVAASGGYHISSGADRIYADCFTRTGSIGVVTWKPSLAGWDRKHGVHEDDFDRGAYMRGWSVHEDWDRELQATADSAIAETYRRFVTRVAEGRGLPVASVYGVAQGRVWMGEDARDRRLVDEIGGLEEAIAEARRRGGIPAGERIRMAEFRRPRPPFFQRLAGSLLSSAWERSTGLPEPGEPLYWADDESLGP
jgi:protease-4